MRYLDDLYELQNYFLNKINADGEEPLDDEVYLAMVDNLLEYFGEPVEVLCD